MCESEYLQLRSLRLGAIIVAFLFVQACTSKALILPTGPGKFYPDYQSTILTATTRCAAVETLGAELTVSGRAGHDRLRSRVLAGLAQPGSVRLEGVAPFGGPTFILTATPTHSTLLLPRDSRVLVGVPAQDILDALIGVRLAPDVLRRVLSGCLLSSSEPVDGRVYGTKWLVVKMRDGDENYLQFDNDLAKLVAVRSGNLLTKYSDFLGAMPRRVQMTRFGVSGAIEVEVTVLLAQIRVNTPLSKEIFSVDIPTTFVPITLENLRSAGPMRDLGGS